MRRIVQRGLKPLRRHYTEKVVTAWADAPNSAAIQSKVALVLSSLRARHFARFDGDTSELGLRLPIATNQRSRDTGSTASGSAQMVQVSASAPWRDATRTRLGGYFVRVNVRSTSSASLSGAQTRTRHRLR